MSRPRTLVVVLAGGAGSRLELLTEQRAKPAVPFGGHYRLVDFPLSSCLHAGIADVWVVTQFHPRSLATHLSGGRPWDLDRTVGGLLRLHPHLGDDKAGWHQGTADALWREADSIRDFAAEALVVVSADAVYRLDYAALVDEHLESGAGVTMVTTRVAADDADRYGVVRVEGDKVVDYAYKPDEPSSDLVSNEVFVFDPRLLLDRLEGLADGAGDDGLDDLGSALLPGLVDDGVAREHRFDGYWRDVGTVDAYLHAHLDLLAEPTPFQLDDPAWPIRTAGGTLPPAQTGPDATVSRSLLSGGARVDGTVTHSVLGPRVLVEAGAVVRDSVLLPGAVVRAGATVERAVVDDGVEIGAGAQVGSVDGDVALLGLGRPVEPGARIAAGARHPS